MLPNDIRKRGLSPIHTALYQSQPREAHALSERLAAIGDELVLLLGR